MTTHQQLGFLSSLQGFPELNQDDIGACEENHKVALSGTGDGLVSSSVKGSNTLAKQKKPPVGRKKTEPKPETLLIRAYKTAIQRWNDGITSGDTYTPVSTTTMRGIAAAAASWVATGVTAEELELAIHRSIRAAQRRAKQTGGVVLRHFPPQRVLPAVEQYRTTAAYREQQSRQQTQSIAAAAAVSAEYLSAMEAALDGATF